MKDRGVQQEGRGGKCERKFVVRVNTMSFSRSVCKVHSISFVDHVRMIDKFLNFQTPDNSQFTFPFLSLSSTSLLMNNLSPALHVP